MSFVVNVHYKSDPKDLFWQYSGKTHTCLQDAVDELISAQNKPHIDKAVVVGSGTGQAMDNDDLLERASRDLIEARNHLLTLSEKILHISPVIACSSMICADIYDMIDSNRAKKEVIIKLIEQSIQDIKEDFK